MELKTIIRILDITQGHISDTDHAALRLVVLKEWLMDAIDLRTQYLALKKQDAVIRAQYLHELPKLQAQLAALQ